MTQICSSKMAKLRLLCCMGLRTLSPESYFVYNLQNWDQLTLIAVVELLTRTVLHKILLILSKAKVCFIRRINKSITGCSHCSCVALI